ncbi:MAG: hypothetical protein HRU36_03635 [Rickettsiales bacterium]|nr:hypothetical protein [Rickettsiales bacterium]
MAELMPQFDFTTFPNQIIWLVVIFALQYLIIAKVVIPRFKGLFSRRESHLDQQLKQAEESSKKAEELRLDYEQKLEEVKHQHEDMMRKTSKKIELEAEAKISELEKEFAVETKKYEEDFKKANRNINAALNEVSLDLAVDILDKVTQTKVNKKKLVKYIN